MHARKGRGDVAGVAAVGRAAAGKQTHRPCAPLRPPQFAARSHACVQDGTAGSISNSPAGPAFHLGAIPSMPPGQPGGAAAWPGAAAQLAPFVPVSTSSPDCSTDLGLLESGYLTAEGYLPVAWHPSVTATAYAAAVPPIHGAPPPLQQRAPDAGFNKPRMRWNAALHARFVAAVQQLGGALQATPKRILDLMNAPGEELRRGGRAPGIIPRRPAQPCPTRLAAKPWIPACASSALPLAVGLTLFHIKSHLQKYRTALGGGRGGGRGARRGAPARRGTSKRSAASMRETDSGDSGSEGEWEEASAEEAAALGPGPSCALGRRHSGKCAKQQPAGEAEAEQGQPRGRQQEQGHAGAEEAPPAAACAPAAAAAVSDLGLLESYWAGEASIDAELDAALGALSAQLAPPGGAAELALALGGSDDEGGGLLDLPDLPEGLQLLEQELNGCHSGSATHTSLGASGQSNSVVVGGGGEAGNGGVPAGAAAPPACAGSPAAEVPAEAGSRGGSSCNDSQQALLHAALKIQMEMQAQLTATMQARMTANAPACSSARRMLAQGACPA